MCVREHNYWLSTVAMPTPDAAYPLPDSVDVAVIGAGYTGLSAARTLAKSNARVAVLEAETIGWGASSRNGGMVLTGLKLGVNKLISMYGRERTLNRFFPHDLLHAIYRSQRRGVHALSSFPSIHGDQFVDTELQTSEYHAAVARTSAPSNGVSFQGGYPGIVLGKRTRRRQTGIPSADYCHVHAIG